jgi:L-threonylcarbamoyladenylate synthase
MLYNKSEVVDMLASGGLVCMATDTLFALSCDATNQSAVEKLYLTKKRYREKKLPVFFHSIEDIIKYCEVPKIALNLAKKFWPGKLTMVLNLKLHALENSVLGSNIAVRVPGCDEILEIIRKLDRPIIGTSANISGSNNLNTIEEVVEQFSESDVKVFKSNTTISGIQSTIVSFSDEEVYIIREGAISSQEIFASISCKK